MELYGRHDVQYTRCGGSSVIVEDERFARCYRFVLSITRLSDGNV